MAGLGVAVAVSVTGVAGAAGTPGTNDSAGVVHQVSATAQRAALAYWTPNRMRMAATTRAWPGPSALSTTPSATPSATPAAPQPTRLPQAEVTPPKGIPTAVKFGGVPTTGALFYTTGDRRHFCTAAVVNSTAGDLVLTAAHCVFGSTYSANITYVPQYHNGQRPYGAWAVRTITVAAGWRKSHDPDLDFAFLAVGVAGGAKLQARTGGLTIGFDRWYTENSIQVLGHNNTDDEPIHCGTRSFRFRTGQMQFYCHGFFTGTSGGPWVLNLNGKTGAGTVYGIIGGYEQGGDYDWTSYSPYFGLAAKSLFKLAEGSPAPPPSPSPSPSATATPTPSVTPTPTPSVTPTPTPPVTPTPSTSVSTAPAAITTSYRTFASVPAT
jgi:V8-like Glu-specific endopeptidase